MVHPIRRVAALLGLPLIVLFALPLTAAAHAGGEPLIHVPVDHIEAGQPFQVIAADLGENAQVTLELAATDKTVSLGTVVAGPDGHFQTVLTVPPPFPDGYAQLSATSSDGSSASAWVRVGTGPDLGIPGTETTDSLLIDPSLILVAAGAAALAVAIIWRSRGSRGKAQPAPRR